MYLRCPDVFTKRFGFFLFSYLFLFVMHFTSCVLNDHTSTHLHAVMGCITCLFLAASGAAASREANMNGLLGVWESSGCTLTQFRDLLGCSISPPPQPGVWAERVASPPGPKDWLRNVPAGPCHFQRSRSWVTLTLLKSSANLYGF